MKVKPAVIIFVLALAPVTALLAIPGLRIGRTGRHVFLSWPKTATNLTLEIATNLSPPMVWRPASGPVISVGDLNVVTNDFSAPSGFYRLATGVPRQSNASDDDWPLDPAMRVAQSRFPSFPASLEPIFRHVVTRDEATALAMDAANRAVFGYGVAPFTNGRAWAKFNGRRWSWRQRVGYGNNDLEVEVTLTSNGTIEDVRTMVLSSAAWPVGFQSR